MPPGGDLGDSLATEDRGEFRFLAEDDAATALKVLGFYNWSASELEEKLELDRERIRAVDDLIVACMDREGFDYYPLDPDFAAQQLSGFEFQFGTERWSERYGLGVSTLVFVQSELPSDLVGLPEAPPAVNVAEDNPESAYLNSLGEGGRQKYYEALYLRDGSCQEQAYAAIPEYPDSENVAFSELDIEDLHARTLSSPEYVSVEAEAARCLRSAGHEFDNQLQALDYLDQKLLSSGVTEPPNVDYNSPKPLTEDGESLLAELQTEELSIASDLWRCGAMERQLNLVAEQIALELVADEINES